MNITILSLTLEYLRKLLLSLHKCHYPHLSIPMELCRLCIILAASTNNKWIPTNATYHHYSTHSRYNIHSNQYSSSLCQKGPSHSASVLYNKVPDYIKDSISLSIFKKKLKILLSVKCYYSVPEYLKDKF
jgi:hypothetical protein